MSAVKFLRPTTSQQIHEELAELDLVESMLADRRKELYEALAQGGAR